MPTNVLLQNSYGAGQEDRRRNALMDQQLQAQEQAMQQQARMGPLQAKGLNLQNQALEQQMGMVSQEQELAMAGVLGQRFAAIAQSADPKQTAMMVLQSPEMQKISQLLQMPLDQFTVEPDDDPEELRQQAADLARAFGQAAQQAAVPVQSTFTGKDGNQYIIRRDGTVESTGVQASQFAQRPVETGGGTRAFNPATGQAGPDFIAPDATAPALDERAAGTQDRLARQEAETELGLQDQSRRRNFRNVVLQTDRILSDVQRATGAIDWTSTGSLGQLTGWLKSSPAGQLDAMLRPIRASLSFDRLQQMRDASPTGGALGQVSNVELSLLEGAVAALDPGYGGDFLADQLGKVAAHYENWKLMQGAPAEEVTDPNWLPVGYVHYDDQDKTFYEYVGGDRTKEASWRKR